eukprot:scaffold77088_cov45-Phaeocystis_antarctica.AAC.1
MAAAHHAAQRAGVRIAHASPVDDAVGLLRPLCVAYILLDEDGRVDGRLALQTLLQPVTVHVVRLLLGGLDGEEGVPALSMNWSGRRQGISLTRGAGSRVSPG